MKVETHEFNKFYFSRVSDEGRHFFVDNFH